MRAQTSMLILAAGLAVAGCTGPQTVVKVDELLIQTPPEAINWDNVPGPDGLEVAVLFFNYEQKQSLSVDGTLLFNLYEGVVPADDLAKSKPRYTWVFTPAMLQSHQVRSAAGWAYAMQLAWGRAVPIATSVTLTVQYNPPHGPPVYANRPITIAMTPR